jgi:hypothetical protein
VADDPAVLTPLEVGRILRVSDVTVRIGTCAERA